MAGTLGTIMGQVRLDVRQAVAAYAAVRAQNQRTVYAMRGTGESMKSAGLASMAMGGVMLYAFGKAVSAAAEFERKMDFFGAVTDTNAAKMQELSKFTLQLATDTIYSADQIAEGFIELGKAGVSAEQIMAGMGEAMANLGAAGDIPLAESGQIITSTIQQFKLEAEDAVRVTDLLAGAANASIADITDIGVSLKYVGGVANAAGLTFEDTATAISILAKAGIRGSTAGTSLRQMIVSLGGATGPARKTLTELGIITEDGANKFFTAEGKAKSLSQVFQILQDHTANLTQKQRLMALRTIFNNRALSAASILTRDGAKGFAEMSKEMAKTTAADVAAKRLDNLSGDIEILKGNLQTLLITSGTPFQEMLRGWVQGLTKVVQWFNNLSPGMQKAIVSGIAITGVVLVLGGAFIAAVGYISMFVSAILKFAAAMKILLAVVKVARVVMLAFSASLFANPIGLIVLAIIALVAAFVIAYKKSETFRAIIDALWAGIKKFGAAVIDALKPVIEWFKLLVTEPGKAWDALKSGAANAVAAVGRWMANLGKLILAGMNKANTAIINFALSVIRWFLALPGKVLGTVAGFVAQIASYFTFKNIGFALGFLLGTIIRIWLKIWTTILGFAAKIVVGVGQFFARLPGIVFRFLASMVSRAISLWVGFHARVFAIAGRIVNAVINFFARLPGRVVAFVVAMVSRAIALFNRLRSEGPAAIARMHNAIVNWFARLPGRVAAFISSMVNRAIALFHRLIGAAQNLGSSIYNGVMGGLSALPGAVAGIFSNVVSAMRGQISAGIAAVTDFAAGMWSGFKKGLGINSPSYIEEAMWQITGVLEEETKKIAKQTMAVQRLSKQMAATEFSVGSDSGASGYTQLAIAHSANQRRSQELAAVSGMNSGSDAIITTTGNAQSSRIVSGELRLDKSGRAFISGVAADVDDQGGDYDDTLARMGR